MQINKWGQNPQGRKMKNKRVLFLDGAPNFVIEGVEIIPETKWSEDTYSAFPWVLKNISEFTEKNEVDIVVIGNNLGYGLSKASAVTERLRGQILVVWHTRKYEDEALYKELGITHFGERRNLITKIQEMLRAR